MSDVKKAAGRLEAILRPALNWRSALRTTAPTVQGRYDGHSRPILTSADDKPAHVEHPIEFAAAWGFSVVARIAVKQGPIAGIVAVGDGSRLVVTNYGTDSVSVIDTRTCALVQTVTGIGEPFGIALGDAPDSVPSRADARRVYVSGVSAAYDAITVIDVDTNTVIATHPLAFSISDVAVSPDGQRVYVGRSGVDGADVAVLDTTTEQVDEIDLAKAPGTSAQCLSVSPDGQRLYVATHGPSGGEVAVIDTATHRVIDTIEIGSAIRDVVLNPDGATVYVGSCDPSVGGLVDVIDSRTNAITGTVRIGDLLTQLVLSRDGDRVYALNDDTVTTLCTWTHDVIGAIRLGSQPSCMVESPDGSHLYVADCAGSVTAISIVSSSTPVVAEVVGDAMLPPSELWQRELAMA